MYILRNFSAQKPTLVGGVCDVFLHHLCHLVVEVDKIKGPALVSAGHFLSHGRQESLWVEEASHPEYVRPAFKDPREELAVTVKKVREPEAKGSGLPRNLKQDSQ